MTKERKIEILKDLLIQLSDSANILCTREADERCEVVEECIKVLEQPTTQEILSHIETGITATGPSDSYCVGFCNALIWLKACITHEEPQFFEDGKVSENSTGSTTSEDCVSRAEVIDELNRLGRNAFKDDTDYDNFFAFVDSLPPITPTHKSGLHWIERFDDKDKWLECPHCHKDSDNAYAYCPNCGASFKEKKRGNENGI